MTNERWIILPLQAIVRKDTPGPHPETGQDHVFPDEVQVIYILKGYHSRTRKFLHEYGPFSSLPELESFAKEHRINLSTETQS